MKKKIIIAVASSPPPSKQKKREKSGCFNKETNGQWINMFLQRLSNI